MSVRTLLIEDNLGDVRLLEELLGIVSPGKYDIQSASTLQEGLALLQASEFDIILTDLNLPDASGAKVISRIQDCCMTIPIVVMSGQDSNELALHTVQMGAQDYLVKGQGDGHLINRAIEYAIERKRHEQKLSYMANYDSLTGLVNRTLFRERLDRALIRADRNNMLVALLLVDLDRFKTINDSLGHDAGDELLIQVARRFEQCTREEDTVARLGGDEFTIIMENVNNLDDAVTIADKILTVMRRPFNLFSHEVYISPTIGVSLYPTDAMETEQLLKCADAAMYCAKDNGRNCYHFYTTDMNKKLLSELNLEAKLRQAVEKKSFMLYYQPKFNIITQRLIGAEALIRWAHPDDGMISPELFIPLAEDLGLISLITDWVLNEACTQNYLWQQEGYLPIRIAINLSPKQFNKSDIAHKISEQIKHTNLSPEYVELEITEGALMNDVRKSNEILRALKDQGIHISIDDFGTGYSSLSYLKKFHLDTLKIDQSFVHDIQNDQDSAAIVSAIIAMAKSLRLNVIAEGVETRAQMNYLAEKNCQFAQGYLLGRPVPAQEFTQFFNGKSSVIKELAV